MQPVSPRLTRRVGREPSHRSFVPRQWVWALRAQRLLCRAVFNLIGRADKLSNQPPRKSSRPGGGAAGKTNGTEARSVRQGKASERPGWANGLRQLYDAVVDEPLPDAFRDLLSQLDRKS